MFPKWEKLMTEIRTMNLTDLTALNRAVVAQIKATRAVAATNAAYDLRDSVGRVIMVVDPRHGTRQAMLKEAHRTRCVVVFLGDPQKKQWSVPANWINAAASGA